MYMTDQQRLAEARSLAVSLDRLTRNPKKFNPSAPWIIPAMMVFVAVFAIVCFVVKLLMNYLNSKKEKAKNFALSEASSPDIPTTPEDQTSMATTASMKTRGSLRPNQKSRRSKPPPVSLYQIKQMQSPGSAKSRHQNKAAMKALSRAARSEANKSLSKDNSRQEDDNSDDNNANKDGNNSPNLSQRSDDTDEVQATVNQSGLVYGAASSRHAHDEVDNIRPSSSQDQPELHTVQIRDLEDNVQHSQATWQQTESDI